MAVNFFPAVFLFFSRRRLLLCTRPGLVVVDDDLGGAYSVCPPVSRAQSTFS